MDDSERRVRLEALFGQHAATVRAYARRRIDRASAYDVVSEVFVVVWRRLEEVPEDALPWLLGCARRVLANQHRGARRTARLRGRLLIEPSVPAPELPSDATLSRALMALSGQDRELLLLIAWEGLEPKQAAQVLGCSPNALGVRLHRARQRLTDVLARIERAEVGGPEWKELVDD